MTYALGTVKPWVRTAADEIGGRFGVSTIYGVGARANVSDHPLGLALDFMVYGDKAKGDEIASYAISNIGRFSITYILWYQRIYHTDGRGWEAMEDRGSPTANHMDHVHISFSSNGKPVAANGGMPMIGKNPLVDNGTLGTPWNDPLAPVKALGSALTWITDWHNLARIGLTLLGIWLIVWGFLGWNGLENAGKIADTAKGYV